MTCRVARWLENHTQMESVYCCECGSTHLEMFVASKTMGPHLCSICAQSMVGSGAAESMTRSPGRNHAEARGADLCDELQFTAST
jgi:hypothetical protein